MIKQWDDLPVSMKNDYVLKYYEILRKKKIYFFLKKIFDVSLAFIILAMLLPIFVLVSILIKIDSKGPIIFRQVRVTQYGKKFNIYKFRTMVNNAEKIGTQITTQNDSRVTKVGKVLRKLRLDEIPQLFNIIKGDMSFVGTRPEVVKYVEKYTDEMMVTLLLPAGITSEASIQYKDEERLLAKVDDADEIYINRVLPDKMNYNLKSIEEFSFFCDIKIMFKTVLVVFRKE